MARAIVGQARTNGNTYERRQDKRTKEGLKGLSPVDRKKPGSGALLFGRGINPLA
jgi:hypothetical protein